MLYALSLFSAKNRPKISPERLRNHANESVLVAGHSNTVPQILASLGVKSRVVLADGDYGDLFVVKLSVDGSKLDRRRFGD